ncbi:MAG: hypothetical protein OXH14_06890 [Alphaproteobacteria bacterium]|nr:hypothetical protein [Alphaproteobacteria bacterium]MYE27368.1 hypothetical protein [Chloroflexota bacterium]
MARIESTGGDDKLIGTAGADTFVFAEGHGDDNVGAFQPGTDTIDLSGFGAAISWEALSAQMTSVGGGFFDEAVKIDLSPWGGGTITLWGVSSPDDLTEDMFILPAAGDGDEAAGNARRFGDGDDFVVAGIMTDGQETTIDAGGGDDTIWGRQSHETLFGGTGDDWIVGGEGSDRIVGGAGDDVLTGGDLMSDDADPDTFVFAPGEGHDRITDFTCGEDIIDLSAFDGIGAFSDLTARQDGEDVVIDFSGNGGGSITLENVSLAELDEDDFVFHDAPAGTEPALDGL